MNDEKKSFVLYSDLKEVVKHLPDDKAGQLFKHILSYVNNENPETDDMIINLTFEPIKAQLKRDLKKWEERAERSRLNGSKGGRPKKPKETQEEPKKPSGLNGLNNKPKKPVNDNVNVTVNVNDTVNVIESRKQAFTQAVKEREDLPIDDLLDFIGYWTEHGPKDKKMRFEKQTSFDINRRLGTWMKNKRKFAPKENKNHIEQRIETMQQVRSMWNYDENGNLIDE